MWLSAVAFCISLPFFSLYLRIDNSMYGEKREKSKKKWWFSNNNFFFFLLLLRFCCSHSMACGTHANFAAPVLLWILSCKHFIMPNGKCACGYLCSLVSIQDAHRFFNSDEFVWNVFFHCDSVSPLRLMRFTGATTSIWFDIVWIGYDANAQQMHRLCLIYVQSLLFHVE